MFQGKYQKLLKNNGKHKLKPEKLKKYRKNQQPEKLGKNGNMGR